MADCSVYIRGDWWFVESLWTSDVGLAFAGQPLLKVPSSAAEHELGQAVLTALAGSRQRVPMPPPSERRALVKPLLALAGVKSWSTFARGARYVMVSSDRKGVSLAPTRPSAGGFDFLPEAVVRVRSEPAEIGRTLRQLASSPNAAAPESVSSSNDGAESVALARRAAWLAIRDRTPPAVAAALGLRHTRPADWTAGLQVDEANHELFVSPPIRDWTLVVGLALPHAFDHGWLEFLGRSGDALGEVHYFGNEPVTEYHAWGRARNGRVERAFAYLGERNQTLVDVGEPAAVEPTDGRYPASEDVQRVAIAWTSVDPWEVGPLTDGAGGIVGVLPAP